MPKFTAGNMSALKHGHASNGSPTPEYRSWQAMKRRCIDPKNANFKHYGGSGVSICEQWMDSFENFLADVGQKPSLAHTLDRFPNQYGNYEPGNVRWATRTEQSANMRKTQYVLFNGKLTAFCTAYKALGISKKTAQARIRLGWSPQEAIDTPVISRIPDDIRHKIRIATGSQSEIAAKFGISQGSVSLIRNNK